MERRPVEGMVTRAVLFIVLSVLAVLAHTFVMSKFFPVPPRAADVANNGGKGDLKASADANKAPAPAANGQPAVAKDGSGKADPAAADDQPADGKKPAAPDKQIAQNKPRVFPPKWITLGSLDPSSPYRMLVTLASQGAAVSRIELSSASYRDTEHRNGYIGHLSASDSLRGEGCRVDVVGPGTPAARAGLRPGDVIRGAAGQPVTSGFSLDRALAKSKPGQTVTLDVLREGAAIRVPVTLGWRPLEVVRPESDDPLSLLLTLNKIDAESLPVADASDAQVRGRDERLFQELEGVDLRSASWELVDDPAPTATSATFRRELPQWGLRLTKTYRLAADGARQADGPKFNAAYHLTFDIKVENYGDKPHEVAYQLDGPTGLPTEGAWYASKVGPGWGAYGLRDVAVAFEGMNPDLFSCQKIADGKTELWNQQPIRFIGVDAQYFSALLIPAKGSGDDWFSLGRPLRVGAIDPDSTKTTNVSCRLVSDAKQLAPGEAIAHRYTLFAGPKRPELLATYGVDGIIYYGWFWWVAKPMLAVLHFFHDYVVFNYGLAIIMLTVLVRGVMFPIGRRQAENARKMQELQPEIKRIAEKYKKDLEGRTKAQQELFRKHNYHPLAGCWVIFLQLPIFVGLYRALMVDVELRQAPLISESIRWASNLAAPDMLIDWSGFWAGLGWDWFNLGHGMFALGPYFNILPIISIALMIVQQKMFMPPPADEQAALQQKMMNFMMVFMGFMFYRVASGLCLYFIASSLWGIAERKLLPHHRAAVPSAADTAADTTVAAAGRVAAIKPLVPRAAASDENGSSASSAQKKRRRPRK